MSHPDEMTFSTPDDIEVERGVIAYSEEPVEIDHCSIERDTLKSLPIRGSRTGFGREEKFEDPILAEAARSFYEASCDQLSSSFSRSDGVRPLSPENLTESLISPRNLFSSITTNGLNQKAFSLLVPKEIKSDKFEMETKKFSYTRSKSEGFEPEVADPSFTTNDSLASVNGKPKIQGELGKLLDCPRQSSYGVPSTSVTPFISQARLLKSGSISTSSSSSSASAPNHFFEKFRIRIMKLDHNMELNQPYVKVTFGDKVFVTPKSLSPSGDWDVTFEFLVSYHYQLFGTCQLDLYESNWLLPDVHRGRAEIRLASLEGFPKKFDNYYELYEKKYSAGTISELARRTKHMQNLGAIQVMIQYRFMRPSDWQGFEIKEEREPIPRPEGDEQFVKIDDDVVSPRKRHSLLVSDPSYLDHEDEDNMFDFVGSYILSKEVRTVLRGVLRVYLAFFQGMELRYAEFFSGVLLLEKFSRDQSSKATPAEDLALTNFDVAREACLMHRFAMAVYGWRGLLVFGHGTMAGPGKAFSDPHAVLTYLGIKESQLLGYEFHTSQVFQPTYFIVLDGDALVLSIRGTMSVLDTMTDLVCDYLPWRGGLVHSGILTAAQALMRNVIPGLMSHAVQHQVRRIYLVGHSLGGGAASLLTMMLLDHLHEFRLPGPTIDIQCYAYGPPPSVCIELANALPYRNHIHSVINGHDLVPRLSYGSMMDFKHMVMAATEVANDNIGSFLSFERLASAFHSSEVAAENLNLQFKALEKAREHQGEVNHLNPKLYIPGKIYVIKTSNQLPEPFFLLQNRT
ncbi:hypothetical protein DSO57_1036695 [Entomophthora muscae]|uniref:Uncharacterized protein n=2 Tax=Entomophthora muscae TaxID=34485 RepID=A0ACC2U8V8_9FUNG|nr:hypothetical protein DSO57_1036695 [Entomophthora muscae]